MLILPFFAQELYEPLWEELLARSKANGFRIRSIWMADVAHQGQSGVLNEHLLGNDRMRSISCYMPILYTDRLLQPAGLIIPAIFSI